MIRAEPHHHVKVEIKAYIYLNCNIPLNQEAEKTEDDPVENGLIISEAESSLIV
jgi:hypothetical protein